MDTARALLLLIGPLPIPGDHIGGAKVSFGELVRDLENDNRVTIRVVNTSRSLRNNRPIVRRARNLLAFFRVLVLSVLSGRRANAWILNASSGGVLTLLPVLGLLASLTRSPLSVRVFGGDLDVRVARANPLQRRLFIHALSRCKVVALQTKKLCEHFASCAKVQRFPTTRRLSRPIVDKKNCRRFVFVGQIREEKGVAVLLEAMQLSDSRTTLSLIGSPMDTELVSCATATPRTRYIGEAEPSAIAEVLDQHDALILPTFWPGEGLPGVIIEAFQRGLPVIATHWNELPELVSDGVNGLLVKPRSVAALVEAMNLLVADNALFAVLARNAKRSGDAYTSEHWNSQLVTWCLAERPP